MYTLSRMVRISLILAACAVACTKTATPPRHISDDFAAAKQAALAEGKLIFVDAWAPWCHTCWSMKREVLHDPSLNVFGRRYVFVEIDTDKPENAEVVPKLSVRTWPTFYVIDPSRDAIIATNAGSMSLSETRAFLERGLALAGGGGPADTALADGYALLQTGDVAAAIPRFEAAARHDGIRRTEALGAHVRALRQAKEWVRCTQTAMNALDVVVGSAAAGDMASYVSLCSSELAKDDPLRAQARAAAQKKLAELIERPPAGASVDDRADVMGTLAELLQESGDEAGARALHERRLKLMEDDAARAPNPTAARAHDYARMNSYLALGRGDEAVKLFQERLKQFPDDYEVHARLASTLHQLGREEEAEPVARRAVELSYGPRRVRYLKLLADIRNKRGDAAGERAALEQLILNQASK
jgi:thioredoxin-like negative regulator of GroEL